MRSWSLFIFCFVIIGGAFAQNEPLQSNRIELVSQINAFGVEEQILIGNIVNNGQMAFENVQVFADILNAEGDVIGEAFGFLADQCGEAILDAPLQPEQSRRFFATVDIFGEGDADEFDFVITGTEVEPEVLPERDVVDGIERIAMGEVVLVEWEDDNSLRYGIGCDGDLFTNHDWYRYQIAEDVITPLAESPNAQYITDAFLLQTGINTIAQSGEYNETLINSSYLTFPTQSRRVVYQNDINTLWTAELDGSFKRQIQTRLSQFSLQGFVWSPLGNFVATYFGAYGEPVQYFTASSTNTQISAILQNNTPSVTMPGLTDDGRRVIIGGTFPNAEGEAVTGYWFSSAITQQRELLYEVEELPGNNYPAPAYYRQDPQTRFIYTIRPVGDVPILECFYNEGSELNMLSELPLILDTDERAWTFLSPDNTKLAIAANGDHGGLWIVDLENVDTCRNSLQ